MTTEGLVAATSFGFSLVCLWGLAWAFRDYQEDNLRDQLFALRDEMFLYADDEGLMDSPAHQNLRALMNGLIRYTHRVTFLRVLVLLTLRHLAGVKIPEAPSFKKWNAAVAKLPLQQREKFKTFHHRAGALMIKHIVLTSPLMWLVVASIVLYLIFNRTKTMLFDRAVESISGQGRAIALLEAEAVRFTGAI